MDFTQFRTKFSLCLDEQQETAVQAVEGPVLLLAVPGSGKTTVLVTRLGYMRYVRNILSDQILTMTYTVAAARGYEAAVCGSFWRGRGGSAGVSHDQRRVQQDHPVL